jgi:tRNA nucleotidyltransferase/poly(A) polymerase
MLLDKIPQSVKQAMQILEQAGCTPYIVGGAVRDLFMGKEPHDYDIASNLTPEQVLTALKRNAIPVVEQLGNNFGVVVGLFEKQPIEIATFRKDKYGTNDAHRPESVTFSKTIEEDLSRRDFTMNAIAIDLVGNMIDPFNGRKDIQEKLLRTVGDPSLRYTEDPLRMYRACRFVSQLGFTYIENGASSVFVKKDFWKECNAKNISMERVRQELEKMLLGSAPDKGLALLMTSGLIHSPFAVRKNGEVIYEAPLESLAHLEKLEQNSMYHMHDAWEHTLQAVRNVPQDLKLRWAMLFHDAGKGMEGVRKTNSKTGQPTDYGHEVESARIVSEALSCFGYNDSFIREVNWLVKNHMSMPNVLAANKRQLRHWIRKKIPDFRKQSDMLEAFTALEYVFEADLAASRHSEEEQKVLHEKMAFVLQMIAEHTPVHSSDLAISGTVILNLIRSTTLDIRDVYADLLKKVQDGVLKNEETALIEAVQKIVLREEKRTEVDENGNKGFSGRSDEA